MKPVRVGAQLESRVLMLCYVAHPSTCFSCCVPSRFPHGRSMSLFQCGSIFSWRLFRGSSSARLLGYTAAEQGLSRPREEVPRNDGRNYRDDRRLSLLLLVTAGHDEHRDGLYLVRCCPCHVAHPSSYLKLYVHAFTSRMTAFSFQCCGGIFGGRSSEHFFVDGAGDLDSLFRSMG